MATSCIAGPAVVADPDLVAREFEAIVAANYPPSDGREFRRPPVVRRATATRVERPGDRARSPVLSESKIRTAGRRPRARERSPPFRSRRQYVDRHVEGGHSIIRFRPDPSSPRRDNATPTRSVLVTPTPFVGRRPSSAALAPRASWRLTSG